MKKGKKAKSSFAGKIRENAERRKKGSSYGYLMLPKGVDVFTPEIDTKVVMDIMPYRVTDKHHMDAPNAEVGELWFKKPFKTHRSVGANNETVVCPTTIGKKCPICEQRNKLRKEGGEEEEIRALRPSIRNLYAIILKGKKSENKIQLFEFSDFLFHTRFVEQLSDDERFDTFPDLAEGSSISVRFAENNFAGNKYAEPTRFDFVDRKEPYDEDILDEVPNLDEVLTILSYEELRAKFFELEEDDDDEDDEKTSRKKKTSVSKTKKVKDDEDDDDEDDDDEQDADDDEDDNDEDDNDDDDDDSDDDDDEDDDDEDDDDEDDDDEDDEPVKPSKKTPVKPSKKTPVKSPVKPVKKAPVKTTKRRR